MMSSAHLQYSLGQAGNGSHVVVGLGWLSNHKIEFYESPGSAIHRVGNLQQFFCGYRLIDYVTHPVCRRLRGEGKASFAPPGQRIHQIYSDTIHA